MDNTVHLQDTTINREAFGVDELDRVNNRNTGGQQQHQQVVSG